jgi:DNA replication protein DnaC
MEHIGNLSGKIAEWARRCAERAETPEYRANAARLTSESAADAQRQAESDRKLDLLRSGVPMGLWDAVEKPNATDATREVGQFLAAPAETFCVLAGPKGRGKTFAICWAVATRTRTRRDGTVARDLGRFVEAQDMVSAGTFDASFWGGLEAAPLLGLDELGAEHPNSAFEASLYALLNKRHQHGRKTIIGTNLDAAGFRLRYGSGGLERLIDRLKTGRWVNLPGESMRTHWTNREPGEEG